MIKDFFGSIFCYTKVMSLQIDKPYKTGIYIGKFFPMHFGHISSVRTLASLCQTAFVFFWCEEKTEQKLMKEFGKEYFIDLRIADAQTIFKNSPNIKFVRLDISNSTTFPADYLKIKAQVEQIVGTTLEVQIFGAEERVIYEPYIYADSAILGSEYDIESETKEIISLHATSIRRNYAAYKKYLPTTIQNTLDSL